MKKKKIYQQPRSSVTRVELESPICSGSVEIANEQNNMGIKAQEVNSDFNIGYTEAAGGSENEDNGWTVSGTSTSN